MKSILTALGALVLVPLLMLYSCFSWGLITLKFYTWFILPVFVNLPLITLVQAVGFIFFIGLFKGVSTQNIKKEYRDSTTEYIVLFITPWLSLLFGWLFKVLFM